jgi:ribonuclease HI
MDGTMKLEIFTDGSATIATKPGGWAYVLVLDGQKLGEGFGSAENVTNNDMELQAAIEGLLAAAKYIRKLEKPSTITEIVLRSDSQIILGWANGSYRFKQEEKFHKFEQLNRLVGMMKVKTEWVEGHSGNEFNERCDELANIARKSLEPAKITPKKERQKKNKALKESVSPRSFKIEEGVMIVRYNGILKKINLTNNTITDYTDSVVEV